MKRSRIFIDILFPIHEFNSNVINHFLKENKILKEFQLGNYKFFFKIIFYKSNFNVKDKIINSNLIKSFYKNEQGYNNKSKSTNWLI